jgi:hypothetical protein
MSAASLVIAFLCGWVSASLVLVVIALIHFFCERREKADRDYMAGRRVLHETAKYANVGK